MPTADFTNEFSSTAGRSNFPRLRLQTNEYARIAIVSQPEVEYTHWLEAPNIVNMAPTYKKVKDRDQNEQWVVETRRVNNIICLGSFEVLKERGVDDHGCQACAESRERPDIFRAPTPRFAANVIRYGLRPGGGWSDIAMPYGIGTLIWVFGSKVMDKLLLIKTMGPGYEDLRAVDLLLTCDDQNFQKPYSAGEFNAVAPAAWMADETRRSHTIQYLAQNCASKEDLSESIAKRVKPDWLADDILRVKQRWDVVRSYEERKQNSPALGQGFGAESFGQGMQNLQQQSQGWTPGGNGQSPAGVGGGGAGQFAQANGGISQGNGGNGQPSSFGGGAGSGWTPNQAAGGFPPPPSAGVDMNLLNGHSAQPTLPSSMDRQPMPAQLPPPPQPGDSFQPSTFARPAADQPSTFTQPAVTETQQQPAQSPPDGLAGLQEFMAGKTSNLAPVTPPPPPAAAQPTPSAGGHYTFDDLRNLGKS